MILSTAGSNGRGYLDLRRKFMNELNSDWVLWVSLLAVAFSIVALVAFGWKLFKSMEGSDEDKS